MVNAVVAIMTVENETYERKFRLPLILMTDDDGDDVSKEGFVERSILLLPAPMDPS